MMEALKTGATAEKLYSVTEQNTALALGSGDLPVLATPALIAFFENAAKDSVASMLPGSATTVGTAISVSHRAPTVVGKTVRVITTLYEVAGRKLRFRLEAYDAAGLVAEGEHERCLVFSEAFMERANERAESEA